MMSKRKVRNGMIAAAAAAAVVLGGLWIVRATARYPALDAPVLYRIDPVQGFQMEIEEVRWSLKKGYCVKYRVAIDSEEVYTLVDTEEKTYKYLERLVDGQWYRLVCDEIRSPIDRSREIGGPGNTGYEEGLYQKYDGYGTRLEPGSYRIVLELTDREGDIHYLADGFEVK